MCATGQERASRVGDGRLRVITFPLGVYAVEEPAKGPTTSILVCSTSTTTTRTQVGSKANFLAERERVRIRGKGGGGCGSSAVFPTNPLKEKWFGRNGDLLLPLQTTNLTAFQKKERKSNCSEKRKSRTYCAATHTVGTGRKCFLLDPSCRKQSGGKKGEVICLFLPSNLISSRSCRLPGVDGVTNYSISLPIIS